MIHLHTRRGKLRPVAIHNRAVWSELNDQLQDNQEGCDAPLTVDVKHTYCSASCRIGTRQDGEEKCIKRAEMKGYMLSRKLKSNCQMCFASLFA